MVRRISEANTKAQTWLSIKVILIISMILSILIMPIQDDSDFNDSSRYIYLTNKGADEGQISRGGRCFISWTQCTLHRTREEVNDWLLWEEARLGGDEHHVVFVEGDGGVKHFHPGHMDL